MDDVTVEVEPDENNVPEAEEQQLPNSLLGESQILFSQYGWAILFISVLTYFAYKKIKSYMDERRNTQSANADDSVDPNTELEHKRAMDAARERFQKQHDTQAEAFAIKLKEKEEAKRQEKIDEWEKHRLGGGYHSKTKIKEKEEPAPSAIKNKTKSRLRNDDYNPLMGGSSGSSYRPPRSCNTGS